VKFDTVKYSLLGRVVYKFPNIKVVVACGAPGKGSSCGDLREGRGRGSGVPGMYIHPHSVVICVFVSSYSGDNCVKKLSYFLLCMVVIY